MAKNKSPRRIETLTHGDARCTNIATAEHQAMMSPEKNAVMCGSQRRSCRYPISKSAISGAWSEISLSTSMDRTEQSISPAPVFLSQNM